MHIAPRYSAYEELLHGYTWVEAHLPLVEMEQACIATSNLRKKISTNNEEEPITRRQLKQEQLYR